MSPTDEEQQTQNLPFADYIAERNLRNARLLALLTATLVPSGVVLDWFTHREQIGMLFLLRLAASVVALFFYYLTFRPWAIRHTFALGAAPILAAAGSLELMIESLEGYSSPYYAGLTHCLLAVGVIFLWRISEILLVSSMIVGLWLVPTLVQFQSLEIGPFFNNFFALVVAALIAIASNAGRYSAARREHTANSRLAEAYARLRELDHAKNQFFANVSHELKTPLTMVLAPLELLIDGELGHISEAQRSTFESMQRSSVKLLRLIGDMLDLSRLEESRVRLRIDEHDLVAYLRGLVQEIEVLAERKGIRLTLETNSNSLLVWCDLERMERVFVNLLSNAIKFTDSGGQVVVVVRDDGDTVLVQVSDTGVGFPPEMSERIFQRFVQADMGSTRRYGGTGIGLALARELVELHGGRISANSEPNVGSVFEVRLIKDRERFSPDVLDRRVASLGATDGKRAGDRTVADWRSASDAKFRLLEIDEATDQRIIERDVDELRRDHTVLIVEDTTDVIRMVRLALHHEFRVYAAKNGEQGLELAQRHRPSVVITDLMMPVMDGLELTRRLRSDPGLKHVPVLMLTARNEVESRVAGLQTGVNAYLGKPFSTKELVSTVRSLVRDQERTMDIVMSQKMDSLETIAGGLAHEIGNPLNYLKNSIASIQHDTELLFKDLEQGAARTSLDVELSAVSRRMAKLFEVAENGVRRIGATVDLMVRYSRDGFSRVHQPYDVYAAVQEVVRVVLPSVRHEVDIKTTLSGSGLMECVPEEVNQVLTNLVQNAVEASPTDGTARIEITGWNDGQQLCLSVRDNGVGISSENQAKVFNAFFTTKETGRGMGLGLTIAYRVMRALGGSIEVQSQLGVGTEFILRAPLAPSKTPRAGLRISNRPPPPPPEA